jgi:hypothetical protein
MARYYFSIKSSRPFNDRDGLELPHLAAVRSEAIGFARDLMLMEPERRNWSRWAVIVTDQEQKLVLDLSFLEAT